MSVRKALIVVVPKQTHESSLDLPSVANDADELAESLRQSGYDVSIVGQVDPSEVTRTGIERAFRNACNQAPRDSTLLLIFSGHGLHMDGKDYIVPSDVDMQSNAVSKGLVSVGEVAEFVNASSAAQIVFFLDACREATVQLFKGMGTLSGWTSEGRKKLLRQSYSIVFSCAKGQTSHYISGKNGFSVFSRSLALALAPACSARSLGEVLKETQRSMLRLADEYSKPRQTLFYTRESSIEREAIDPIICDGMISSRPAGDARSWGDAVHYSPLWMKAENADLGDTAANELRAFSRRLAVNAEKCFEIASNTFGRDPWRDKDYPIRVLRRIEDIVASSIAIDLSHSEVALVLAAPFVREHAYAAALFKLCTDTPVVLVLPEGKPKPDSRQRLEATHRSFPQLVRRVQLLDPKGRDSKKSRRLKAYARQDIMAWLLHRHLSRMVSMWHFSPEGSLPTDLSEPSSIDFGQWQTPFDELFSLDRLLKLAKCVRGETDRLTRRDIPSPLEMSVTVDHLGAVRERLLGCILCLAGWLAVDMRATADILVDHVGVNDSVDPNGVVALLNLAKWKRSAGQLELSAECEHPAVDVALTDYIARANGILGSILSVLVKGKLEVIASSLPQRLVCNLAPLVTDGRPAYATPHQKFHLAQEEVRELLMGEQLYGDPKLAVRELYQNSLDACRYKQARLAFLAQTGKKTNWKGRIVFRQGRENGRPYIECEDNGVGMGLREIESCFSRAGKRFADLPDFIEEQELWLQCDPKIEMTPNSQFGVGVLSYFMIADEIHVATCRMGRDGGTGQRIDLHIPASGSLFRLIAGDQGTSSGTKIRLTLRSDWTGSCQKILDNLLVIADFETEVIENDKRLIHWLPGMPRERSNERYLATDDPDFWFYDRSRGKEFDEGRGSGFLADGLRVSINPENSHLFKNMSSAELGAVVNLRGPRRPKLTVDRKTALSFDEQWVLGNYKLQIRHLISAPWMRYSWLWNLSEGIIPIIIPGLLKQNAEFPLAYEEEITSSIPSLGRISLVSSYLEQKSYPISVLGVSKIDRYVISFLSQARTCFTDESRFRLVKSIALGLDRYNYQYFLYRKEVSEMKSLEEVSGAKTLDVFWKRVALYKELGFQCPDWVDPYLSNRVFRHLSVILGSRSLQIAATVRIRRLIPRWAQRLFSVIIEMIKEALVGIWGGGIIFSKVVLW